MIVLKNTYTLNKIIINNTQERKLKHSEINKLKDSSKENLRIKMWFKKISKFHANLNCTNYSFFWLEKKFRGSKRKGCHYPYFTSHYLPFYPIICIKAFGV